MRTVGWVIDGIEGLDATRFGFTDHSATCAVLVQVRQCHDSFGAMLVDGIVKANVGVQKDWFYLESGLGHPF